MSNQPETYEELVNSLHTLLQYAPNGTLEGAMRILGLLPDAGPRCRYCGADCSEGRSWDGGDLYACPSCADARASWGRS